MGVGGAGWAKWEPVLADPFSDATDVLLDMAAVEPGMRVLDLACGAGSQSIQAARRVGPHGTVEATDISAIMLEHTAGTPRPRRSTPSRRASARRTTLR